MPAKKTTELERLLAAYSEAMRVDNEAGYALERAEAHRRETQEALAATRRAFESEMAALNDPKPVSSV